MLRPLEPVGQGAKVALGISFFVVFVAAWAFATLGGYVSKTFLADPITMVRSGWTLMTEMGFAKDIATTRQTVIPMSFAKPISVIKVQPDRTIVIGSARNVFETMPPKVAAPHRSTKTTKNARPRTIRVEASTGFSGVIR